MNDTNTVAVDIKEETGKNIVVFLDMLGRTIIGMRVEETDNVLKVKNPAVVNVIPQQVADPKGNMIQRMALQLFPLFFREFLASSEEPVVFCYKKNNITLPETDIALNFKVCIQYEQLFNVIGNIEISKPVQPQVPDQGTKIKLFDD